MGVLHIARFLLSHPLNRQAPMAALWRFTRWQLASRLLPGPSVMPFIDDAKLLMQAGMYGATGNYYCGLHEAEEMAFFLHFLRPADHFFDIGANVGSYTILAAAGVGCSVVAAEPIEETRRWLERNVALNELDARVRVLGAAVGEEVGKVRLTNDKDTVNHVLPSAAPGGTSVEVPMTTLDTLRSERAPTAIKIDVEGYEYAVLRGGRATLNDPTLRAISVETNASGERFGVSDDEVRALLRQAGFRAVRYRPLERRLLLEEGSSSEESDSLEARSSGNSLYVRDFDEAAARVRQAPRYRLVNGEL